MCMCGAVCTCTCVQWVSQYKKKIVKHAVCIELHVSVLLYVWNCMYMYICTCTLSMYGATVLYVCSYVYMYMVQVCVVLLHTLIRK